MSEHAVPATERRYEWYSHEAMKVDVESGNEPSAAGEISREWTELAERLHEAGELLTGASGASEDAWSGPGGEAVRAALAKAAAWSRSAAGVSATLADAIASQAEVAAKARAEMPEPVPYDPAAMIRDAAGSGDIAVLVGLSDALSARREEAEAARQKAIDVMYARDAALRAAVPDVSFTPPPALTEQGRPARE